MSLHGACLCCAVAYRLATRPDMLNLCHCLQCRRANGGIGQPVIVAAIKDVAFDGAPPVTEYESSPGKHRAFCAGCGSPVYSRRDDMPGVLRLRAGLIADLPEPVTLHQAYRETSWPWLGRLARLMVQDTDGDDRAKGIAA